MEFLEDESDEFCFVHLQSFVDSIDDAFDKLGSNSGSSGTYSFCTFSLGFDDSVGSVSVLGSGVFAPTGVESKGDIFAFGVFVPTGVESKGGQLIEKNLVLKFLILFPNLKLRFILIVVVRICLTKSNCCSPTKNMIRRAKMGTTHRPSDYGSGGTDTTA